MNKKLKYILITFTFIFIVGVGAVSYFVSQKINSEEIHKQVLIMLGKTFPNSKVELGKIDVSLEPQ